MTSYAKSILVSGERIDYTGHINYIILLPAIAIIFLSLIVVWPLCLIGLAILAWQMLVIKSNEYVVTNQRVILKTGIISWNTFEMRLQKIEGVSVQQTILGRILDYGQISIYGTGGSSPDFKFMDNPLLFKRYVEEAALGVKN